jgi:hypothetical protein
MRNVCKFIGMRIATLLTAFLLLSCVNSQTTSGVLGVAATSSQRLLLVQLAESNSGAEGTSLSYLSTAEKSPRPLVQHWHNTTGSFQDLHIGTNNLIDHFGLTDNAHFGIEAAIADRMEAGTFVTGTVYHLKRGQGGSKSYEWTDGSTYDNKLAASMNGAISAIQAASGQAPQIHVFYTWGINDYLVGTSAATFKAALLSRIDTYRTRWGSSVKFYVTELPAAYDSYNAIYTEIAAERTGVYVLDTTGEPMSDSYHWSSAGIMSIGNKFVDSILSHLDE